MQHAVEKEAFIHLLESITPLHLLIPKLRTHLRRSSAATTPPHPSARSHPVTKSQPTKDPAAGPEDVSLVFIGTTLDAPPQVTPSAWLEICIARQQEIPAPKDHARLRRIVVHSCH
jgi:hypothetical protein